MRKVYGLKVENAGEKKELFSFQASLLCTLNSSRLEYHSKI